MKEEDFTKSMQDLEQLRDALVYWGKIIQRQTLIKYIKSTQKLQHEAEFTEIADEQQKFIETEKAKYQGDETSKQEINAEKLKIAQVIDREARVNKMWEEEDEELDEFESDPEEQPERREDTRGRGGRGGRGGRDKGEKGSKAAQRPNKQKFAEIMKGQNAFPTLENEFADDAEEELSEERQVESQPVKEEAKVEAKVEEVEAKVEEVKAEAQIEAKVEEVKAEAQIEAKEES